MKKTHLFFIFVFPIISGCSSMYIPSPKNAPLFERKGEIQAEAGMSTNSIYATGSYAFSEKYALIANGSLSFRNFSEQYDIFTSTSTSSGSQFFTPTNTFAHRYAEGGLGRYNLLASSRWKLEIFGGGGYGEARTDEGDYRNYYWLGFLQGNIGKRWRFIEYGWSLRMAYSGFHFFYHSDTWPSHPLNFNFNNIHTETFAFLRMGQGAVRGFVRGGIGITCPLQSMKGIQSSYGIENEGLVYTILHLSAGISFRF